MLGVDVGQEVGLDQADQICDRPLQAVEFAFAALLICNSEDGGQIGNCLDCKLTDLHCDTLLQFDLLIINIAVNPANPYTRIAACVLSA